jgi:hypothetical protein
MFDQSRSKVIPCGGLSEGVEGEIALFFIKQLFHIALSMMTDETRAMGSC